MYNAFDFISWFLNQVAFDDAPLPKNILHKNS